MNKTVVCHAPARWFVINITMLILGLLFAGLAQQAHAVHVWKNWGVNPFAKSFPEMCKKTPEAIDSFLLSDAVKKKFKEKLGKDCTGWEKATLRPGMHLEEMRFGGPTPHLLSDVIVGEVPVAKSPDGRPYPEGSANAKAWKVQFEGVEYTLYAPDICFNLSWEKRLLPRPSTPPSDAVAPPPPSCTITVSKSQIKAGERVGVAWETVNTSELRIGGVKRDPATKGSFLSEPLTGSHRFDGQAIGAGGSANCAATVEVIQPPPPEPVCKAWTLTAHAFSLGRLPEAQRDRARELMRVASRRNSRGATNVGGYRGEAVSRTMGDDIIASSPRANVNGEIAVALRHPITGAVVKKLDPILLVNGIGSKTFTDDEHLMIIETIWPTGFVSPTESGFAPRLWYLPEEWNKPCDTIVGLVD